MAGSQEISVAGAPASGITRRERSDQRRATGSRGIHEALASGDSVTALELLAEDVVIYESGGVEASREEYRSHHLPPDMA